MLPQSNSSKKIYLAIDVTTIAYPGGPLMHENDHELASQIFIAARGTVGLINLANATNYNNVNSVSTMAFETENWADVKNLIDPKGYQAGKYLRGWYCCHYHGLKPDAKTNLIKAMDYIKQHEEDLWVGTFREVAMYGQQRDTISDESHGDIPPELVCGTPRPHG